MKNIVFQLMAAAILAGCSIKEDRTECPCTVTVDFSCIDSVKHSSSELLALTGGTVVLHDTVSTDEYDGEYVFKVQRVSSVLDIFCGWQGACSPGTWFTVEEGVQFPRLYLQSVPLDTSAESVYVTAGPHKVYCEVTIDIKSGGEYPYTLSVTGNYSGYDPSGRTVEGPFSYRPVPDEDGLCSVRIPRQSDSSLMLTIKEEDETLREFALGEYIAQSGYDWTSEDLEDIEVEIDYAKTDVVFKVNDWETVISFEVII